MAPNSSWKPYSSLTEAPTNLKEAIDWVLRVTGRDGKELSGDECICGLAAAVTDLLQSVTLEYNGYEGDTKNGTDPKKGATETQVKEHLNELFSLVQGLGATAVVRTYIDQLAQVLSALVGWSRIETCKSTVCKNDIHRGQCRYGGEGHGNDKCCCKGGAAQHKGSPWCCNGEGGRRTMNCANGCCSHGGKKCVYLADVKENDKCEQCKCKIVAGKGSHLGRGCQRCSEEAKKACGCTPGGTQCTGEECPCAKEGKCCKCCCTNCIGCKNECSCTTEESITRYRLTYVDFRIDRYMSAYSNNNDSQNNGTITTWEKLGTTTNRHKSAQTLLGSVCLIWSGITYMYWTGKWAQSSPRWNNHILDGTGLDDGTLSQWLQALGFPRDMLNNGGPGNRMDGLINDELKERLFLGFKEPDHDSAKEHWGNTARVPTSMNCAGFVHTIHRDSFHQGATVFRNVTTQITDTNQHKRGALFKLYILSCAYFTGLQKRNTVSTTSPTNNPKTIREILYWLSALPYSQAYKEMLTHAKKELEKVLKKPGDTDISDKTPTLAFHQTGRDYPITVHEYNLFAHFQAVTQYCPLVLIGIQGGLHSPKGTDKTLEPAIHSLYANTECHFTYPTVSIQAYNQVVHYIRGLFYQLYFLRKQCAVKVTCGGKWRECRYGQGVVSKGVISWMCLGCSPMEHDRKSRVDKVKQGLKSLPQGGTKDLPGALKELLLKIGEVVIQLGNAQERLDRGNGELRGVKNALNDVFPGVYKKVNGRDPFRTVLQKVLGEKLCEKVKGLENMVQVDGQTSQALGKAKKALETAKDVVGSGGAVVDGCKNAVSAAIDGIHKVLEIFTTWLKNTTKGLDGHKEALLKATEQLISICKFPKCSACAKHSDKCGQEGKPTMCKECGNMTTTGVPSPLQAFLDDRLPGFSCKEVVNDESAQPDYPLASSHLGHCGGSGQCCPLPMGFRGHFQQGITQTGQRLYGILYFFSNGDMMQSCVYTLVRVTAALSATTPQVLGDVFGFFRGGVGNNEEGEKGKTCDHDGDPKDLKNKDKYFCGWCASGLRDEVKKIEWIPKDGETEKGGYYMEKVGKALRDIKGEKNDGSAVALKSTDTVTPSALSTLTKDSEYLSPLTGELYTAVSATFGGTYLSWVLYLSDALEGGLKSLSEAFRNIECRGCKGNCDPNKCRKGEHGSTAEGSKSTPLCQCQSIVSCTGVLPVLYRHGFSYGNPFNLEGYEQNDGNKEDHGQFDIKKEDKSIKQCHEFLESLKKVIEDKQNDASQQDQDTTHPLTNLLSQVGKLQYDIRLPWIFVLTIAWLVAVLYLAFGAIWPLDWTHMRSHWLRGGAHQWESMWYKVMTGRKGMELVEYFGKT